MQNPAQFTNPSPATDPLAEPSRSGGPRSLKLPRSAFSTAFLKKLRLVARLAAEADDTSPTQPEALVAGPLAVECLPDGATTGGLRWAVVRRDEPVAAGGRAPRPLPRPRRRPPGRRGPASRRRPRAPTASRTRRPASASPSTATGATSATSAASPPSDAKPSSPTSNSSATSPPTPTPSPSSSRPPAPRRYPSSAAPSRGGSRRCCHSVIASSGRGPRGPLPGLTSEVRFDAGGDHGDRHRVIQGQIVLPKRIREELSIHEGDRVEIRREGKRIVLDLAAAPPRKKDWRAWRGTLAGSTALQDHVKEHREEVSARASALTPSPCSAGSRTDDPLDGRRVHAGRDRSLRVWLPASAFTGAHPRKATSPGSGAR